MVLKFSFKHCHRSEKDLADSNIQDLRIDAESLLGGRCDTCTALFDVKKVERNEENQPNITPELTTLTLDLKSYVIANYFKLLVKWGTEIELSRTTVVNNTDGDTSLCNFYPLWGEDLSGVDENEKNLCSLSIILDNKAKDYSLVISSSSSLAAERRMRRINDLAVTATLMRDAAAMINWCPQHREALNESNMLREVLNKTKAAVLFHESADRIISADVVALTVEDRKVVFVFLAALVPQQTIWSVPQNCVSDYTIAEWGELRKTFAVKLDVKGSEKRSLKGLSNSQKSTKSLKVWGFEPAMNEALKFILATAPAASFLGPSPTNRKPIVLEPSTSRIFKHALDFRRDGQNSDSSQRGIEFNSTGFINEGALDWEIAQNERKLFQGHFTFLDREAGMLYQAFEKYFKAFIYQSFRIIMRDSESTAADSIQSVAADETNGKSAMDSSFILRLLYSSSALHLSQNIGMECPTFLQGQHRTPGESNTLRDNLKANL